VDLGALAKPVTTLIEKVSDAVGGLAKPFQIRRVAQAEGDAEVMRARTRIEVMDIEERALNRFVFEEAKKQANIEAITAKALPEVTDDANPEQMEDDWITNFFDKCRLISDEEMQTLWARILAGEANVPGTFSRKIVDIVGSLDKKDAELFRSLCGYAFNIDGRAVPLIYDLNTSIYEQNSIDLETVSHLSSLGLVHVGGLTGYVLPGFPQQRHVYYYGQPVWIGFDKPGPHEFRLGNVLLSQAGKQLVPICGSRAVAGFIDYVREIWRSFGYRTDPEVAQAPSA